MQHKDIQVGVVYRYARGKRDWDAAPVIVLDKAKDYAERTMRPTQDWIVVGRVPRGLGDMLVAKRYEVYRVEKIDPETGQPWDSAKLAWPYKRQGGPSVLSHYEWRPAVASPRDIRQTWEEWEAVEVARKQAERERAERLQEMQRQHEYDSLVRSIADHEGYLVQARERAEAARNVFDQARQECLTVAREVTAANPYYDAVTDALLGSEHEPGPAYAYAVALQKLRAADEMVQRHADKLVALREKLASMSTPEPEEASA